ncbi:eCIS core domain-containing protein [Catenulispora rubra]|uniref:eCIS core domain-containing protein n=1 Tax=Catenulispora rubra TaxID=280293 RepID=UPI001892880D|nr:DUF4157 domain-containing protein [Catenulispora rubra]
MSAPAAMAPQAKQDSKKDGSKGAKRRERQPKQRQPLTRPRPAAPRPVEPGKILASAGRPLDWGLRRDFEVQLGHDLSRVRVHTDRDAAGLAELIGADAVTVGPEIFFAAGSYRPETAEGRRLLAHEILHTVQSPQPRGSLGGRRDGDAGLGRVSVASEPIEQEAERVARGLTAGRATNQARQVREHLEPTPGLLRYATVSADNQRTEQLDPATVVDRLVAGLLRSLRGDPDDRSGRVQLQLAKLAPELRENVLNTLQQRIPSSDFSKVMALVGKLDVEASDPPIDSHETPEPVSEPDPESEQDDRETERQSHDEVAEVQSQDKKTEKNEKNEKNEKERPEKAGKKNQHDKDEPVKDEAPKDQTAKDSEQSKDSTEKAQNTAADEKTAPGAPGAQLAAGAIGAAGIGAVVSASAGDGGFGNVAAGAVDDAAFALDSPLLHHGLLRRKGQQKHDTVPPGEEPIGLPADATAEVAAPAEVTPEAEPTASGARGRGVGGAGAGGAAGGTAAGAAGAAGPVSDGLPTSDLDVSSVPTADQIKLSSDGSVVEPSVPGFPAPPKDDAVDPGVPPEQEARERTADYRAEQAQEQREGPQAQTDPGQVGPDAIESEPETEPAAESAPPEPAGPQDQGLDDQSAPSGPEAHAGPDGGELAQAAEQGRAEGGPQVDEASGVPENGAPGAAEPDQQADAAGPDSAQQPDQQADGAPPADGSLEAGGGSCGGAPETAPDTDAAGKGCGGGGGGGGADAAPPAPAPPQVATQEPQAALATVSTLAPDQMQATIGGVDQSVQTSVGKDRAALTAAPPSIERPSGAPQVLNGPPTSAPAVATQVPKMEAPPPQQKGPEQKPQEKQVAKGPAPAANVQPPSVAGDTEGKVTQEEADRVQGSINNIPTTDPSLHTTVGAAPTVQLTGDKDPAQTDQQMDTLHDRSGQVAAVGRQDAALPLGETQIYPNVKPETLKGAVPGPAGAQGGPAAAGGVGGAGAGAGAANSMAQATSVVAQQERGPQFKAAFDQGSTQMGTQQQKKDTDTTQAHEQNQQQIDAAVKEAGTQQADERGNVKQQADQGRQQWRDEQDQKIADANKDADTRHGKARSDVDDQAKSTDKQITDRQDTDNKSIDDQRAKAEDDARKEKAKKRSGGGGFFGWVKSKISAAFNAICNAINDIFDAARKLVQGIISTFTKFVTGLIDLAAKAIVGFIKVFAAGLIALGDVLLAAFPGIRDKFRKLIEGWRDKAIAKVNSIADGLKSAVSKLLSALGSLLSSILDGLQAGLIAAVNYVRNQINNLITWAQQALAVFGEFASIIVDIAQNPGRWISNLATAVKDGVRLYLFGAIVSAVKNWFTQKIESIIGLGKAIFDILVKGCISIGQIVKMAWKALIAALPQMIIQLVIENVIAALIPAAGAVLKIIQGLVAAYNTISRIIAAISTFIKFLKAVKYGQAACLFAQTVASGAVALIDFIANWLLSKLKGAASGITSKLKGIAQKIMAALGRGAKTLRKAAGKAFTAAKKGASKAMAALKSGAKKLGTLTKNGLKRAAALAKRGWNALKRGAKALGHRLANTKLGKALLNGAKKVKQAFQTWKQKASDWWKKKHPPKSPEERLAAAVARIQPKVDWMLGKGVPGFALKAALRGMRIWYRLASLAMTGSSDFQIAATINPTVTFSNGATVDRDMLLRFLRQVSQEVIFSPSSKAGAESGISMSSQMRGVVPKNRNVVEVKNRVGLNSLANFTQTKMSPQLTFTREDIDFERPGGPPLTVTWMQGYMNKLQTTFQKLRNKFVTIPKLPKSVTPLSAPAPPGTSGSYARLIRDVQLLPGGATLAAEMAQVVGGDRTGMANPDWAASMAVLMTDVESMRGKATMATAAMVMQNAMTTGDLATELGRSPMIPQGAQAAADEVNTYLSSGGLSGKTESSLSGGAQAMIKAEVDLVEAWIKLQDIKVDHGSKKSVEDQLCDQIRKRIHAFYGTAPQDVKMFQMWQDAKRQGIDFQTFTRLYRARKG